MILYDKKYDGIHIYKVKEKLNELKKYRKSIINEYKNPNLYSHLTTNSIQTLSNFYNNSNLDYNQLNYEEFITLNDKTEKLWSHLKLKSYDGNINEEYLKAYIQGKFSHIKPKNVIFNPNTNISTNFYLLSLAPWQIQNIYENEFYVIPNLLNLPKTLYILQLLQNGEYTNLLDEDISEELEFFTFTHSRVITHEKINELLNKETHATYIKSIIDKAETESKILRKVMN